MMSASGSKLKSTMTDPFDSKTYSGLDELNTLFPKMTFEESPKQPEPCPRFFSTPRPIVRRNSSSSLESAASDHLFQEQKVVKRPDTPYLSPHNRPQAGRKITKNVPARDYTCDDSLCSGYQSGFGQPTANFTTNPVKARNSNMFQSTGDLYQSPTTDQSSRSLYPYSQYPHSMYGTNITYRTSPRVMNPNVVPFTPSPVSTNPFYPWTPASNPFNTPADPATFNPHTFYTQTPVSKTETAFSPSSSTRAEFNQSLSSSTNTATNISQYSSFSSMFDTGIDMSPRAESREDTSRLHSFTPTGRNFNDYYRSYVQTQNTHFHQPKRDTSPIVPGLNMPGEHLPWKRNSKKMCSFCRRNGETPMVYLGHALRKKSGKKNIVTCPILRFHVCTICGATGDTAHTYTYCPVLRSHNQGLPIPSTTLILKSTKLKSNGQLRF